MTDASRPMVVMPWSHEGYESIHVVVSDSLMVESRSLLQAFRALRRTSSLAEVQREADRIAAAKGVYLAWDSERDDDGQAITIGVLPTAATH